MQFWKYFFFYQMNKFLFSRTKMFSKFHKFKFRIIIDIKFAYFFQSLHVSTFQAASTHQRFCSYLLNQNQTVFSGKIHSINLRSSWCSSKFSTLIFQFLYSSSTFVYFSQSRPLFSLLSGRHLHLYKMFSLKLQAI